MTTRISFTKMGHLPPESEMGQIKFQGFQAPELFAVPQLPDHIMALFNHQQGWRQKLNMNPPNWGVWSLKDASMGVRVWHGPWWHWLTGFHAVQNSLWRKEKWIPSAVLQTLTFDIVWILRRLNYSKSNKTFVYIQMVKLFPGWQNQQPNTYLVLQLERRLSR